MANQGLENFIKTQTSQEVYEVHYGEYDQLKNAALIFLEQINKLSWLNRNIIQQKIIKSQMDTIYANMRQAEKNTQKALQLQHIFEKQLNDFLGRTIYLTYVNKQGNLYIYDDANIGKLYSSATVNTGRGNISASKLFDTMDIEKDLKEKIQYSIRNKAAVFRAAVARWEKEKTQTVKDYNPSKNTFYWRLYDYHISGWTKPFSNRGWIAQGYAGAVINEDKDVSSSNLEESLKNLYEKHMKQDSIGAAIKGDIKLDDNGNIQFAIKSGNSFSTAKFGQYIRLAYNITQIKILTPSQLESVLPKLVNFSKITDEIIKAANSYGEKQLTLKIGKEKYTVILGL